MMNLKLNLDRIATPTTWILRIFTGGVFLYSGFVKAFGAWGTFYKFGDYLSVMHLDVWPNLVIFAVFALCIFEFLTGMFLATGSFRRAAPVMAAALMAVMLPLTLWIAVKDPVADCGCFGDALVITNWQTFWKNVVLTLAVGWLLIYNRSARCLIRPSLQWLGLVFSALFVTLVGEIGYLYQPLIDYRPYPVGSTLVSANDDDDDADDDSGDIIFVYARDGEERRFTIDDVLPAEGSGWKFVRREEAGGSSDKVRSEHSTVEDEKSGDFTVWSEDGEEEMTGEALLSSGPQMLLLLPDLGKVSVSTTWKINALESWAREHNVQLIAIVAATPEQIEEWRDISLPSYPIYTAEDTQIKMLARGNPAVVYLSDGVVKWKSTLAAIPDEDLEQMSDRRPSNLRRSDTALLYNICGVYVALILALAFLSYTAVLGKKFFFSDRRKAPKEDNQIENDKNQ